MRILHVVAPAPAGGLESVVTQLACSQRANGHDVHIAAVVVDVECGATFVERFRQARVAVHSLQVGRRAYLRERAVVRNLCLSLAPDIVHTHGYRPDVVDAGAARRLGIPTVTTLHGFTGGDFKNRLYERLQCLACRRFDAVVTVSPLIAERVIRYGTPRNRIRVVPNAWRSIQKLSGPEARRKLGVTGDILHLGWVGRLSHEKGTDVLLEAVAQLHDLPVVLSVIGDGPDRGALVDRARILGLDGRILWHGLIPQAAQLFTAFDVFVLSSRTEGVPMVLFEAIDAAVPVVTTEVGGVPDVVGFEEALLVQPDDPVALAQGIRAALEDPRSAKIRAENARRRVASCFSWEAWLASYDEIYSRVRRTPTTASV